MKRLFLLMVAVMCATMSYAQNTLVATLSHENEISMYYGSTALQQAVNAASNGDIITLSGGTFQSTEITKAITIRGTGTNAENPTIIGPSSAYDSGHSYRINIHPSDDSRFVMEGVTINFANNGGHGLGLYGTSSNIYFIKCKFLTKVQFDVSSTDKAKFVECNIGTLTLSGTNNVQIIGSYVSGFSSTTSANAEFINCVLFGYIPNYHNSSFINSILVQGNYDYGNDLPSECVAMNSACISYDCFNKLQSNNRINCYKATRIPDLFSTYTSYVDRYNITRYELAFPYELSEEAKTTYLGTDGTQIGMYGGQCPYDPTPSYPRFTKFNVAKQTTADNKLSVEIEVNAIE